MGNFLAKSWLFSAINEQNTCVNLAEGGRERGGGEGEGGKNNYGHACHPVPC